MSAPSGSSIPSVICVRCGKAWPGETAQVEIQYRFVRDNDGQTVAACIDRRYCRGRVLTRKLYAPPKEAEQAMAQKHMFARETRARLLRTMDVRPRDWKETGWTPAYEEWARVDACLTYHSVCFPACMEYACQLDKDDSDIVDDRWTGSPVPLTEALIARLLGMHHQNVNRALQRCQALKRWRKEDGRFYYVAAPGEITLADRIALQGDRLLAAVATRMDLIESWPESLRLIPRSFAREFAEDLRDLPTDELRQELVSRLSAAANSYQEEKKRIKSELLKACSEVKSWTASYSSRGMEVLSVSQSPSSSPATLPGLREGPTRAGEFLPRTLRQPSPIDGHNPELDALYEAGYGEGALAKLPPQEQRTALLDRLTDKNGGNGAGAPEEETITTPTAADLAAVRAAIPDRLCQKLCEQPTPALLSRIWSALEGAPAEMLTPKIERRWKYLVTSPTGSLGLIEELARDVARAWKVGDTAAIWQQAEAERQCAEAIQAERQRRHTQPTDEERAQDIVEALEFLSALTPASVNYASTVAYLEEAKARYPALYARAMEKGAPA